ncbi:M23 family metallopeptidase [Leucobacter sp. GX24907]
MPILPATLWLRTTLICVISALSVVPIFSALPESNMFPGFSVGSVATVQQRSGTTASSAVSRMAVAPDRDLWTVPVGGSVRVSSPFRAPPHRFGSGHRGVDLPAQPGFEVVAPTGGTVSFVGRVVDRGVVSIRIDERTVVSLEPVEQLSASGISKGNAVEQGQLLGRVGTGGHCDDACVHLGVRVNGDYVNPLRFFLERPKLLPWAEQ